MHVMILRSPRARFLLALLLSSLLALGCEKPSSSGKKDDDDSEESDKSKKSKKAEKEEDNKEDVEKKDTGPTVTVARPKVGDKMTERETETSDLVLDFGRREVKIKSIKEVVVTEEILEVDDDGRPTKKKVTYTKHVKTEEKDGKKEPEEVAAVQGKTYVVERKEDALVLTADGGGPVSAAEKKILQKAHKRLGTPSATSLEDAIPNRALKKGQRIPEMEAAATVYFTAQSVEDVKAGKKPDEVKGVKVVFKGVDGDLAVFGIEVEVVTEEEGNLKGIVELDADLFVRRKDGWPMRVERTADFELEPSEGSRSIIEGGSGKTKTTSVYEY